MQEPRALSQGLHIRKLALQGSRRHENENGNDDGADQMRNNSKSFMTESSAQD